MSPVAVARAAVTELALDPDAIVTLAEQSGRSRSEIAHLLAIASDRLQRELSVPDRPIEVSGDAIRVTGVAGLLRIAAGVELEVSPKFLGTDDPTWRSDFFIFASLSRFGRIFETEPVFGGYGERGDLATLVGRTAAGMFRTNRRRPLRLYQRRAWDGFDLEGDLDDEAIVAPSDAGFTQSAVSLTAENSFNGVLRDAFATLLPEIRHLDTRRQVERAAISLPRRSGPMPRRLPTRVPSRARHWQPLYDLALQITAGFGINYVGTSTTAPGYAMKTSNAWEDVVSLALEARMGRVAVRRQPRFPWASRDGKKIPTRPDLIVTYPLGAVVVDAKYKGRATDQARAISAADLYESFAFARACGLPHVLLVYPRPHFQPRLEVGEPVVFDRIDVEDRIVIGVEVECRGLATHGGFTQFATRLSKGLQVLVPGSVSATD